MCRTPAFLLESLFGQATATYGSKGLFKFQETRNSGNQKIKSSLSPYHKHEKGGPRAKSDKIENNRRLKPAEIKSASLDNGTHVSKNNELKKKITTRYKNFSPIIWENKRGISPSSPPPPSPPKKENRNERDISFCFSFGGKIHHIC